MELGSAIFTHRSTIMSVADGDVIQRRHFIPNNKCQNQGDVQEKVRHVAETLNKNNRCTRLLTQHLDFTHCIKNLKLSKMSLYY